MRLEREDAVGMANVRWLIRYPARAGDILCAFGGSERYIKSNERLKHA